MRKMFKLLRDERRAPAIDYGLVAALIVVGAIAAMTGIGSKLRSMSTSVSSNLS